MRGDEGGAGPLSLNSAFDHDSAWMTHLATYYHSVDGVDMSLQTAVEGRVVPEFRR